MDTRPDGEPDDMFDRLEADINVDGKTALSLLYYTRIKAPVYRPLKKTQFECFRLP